MNTKSSALILSILAFLVLGRLARAQDEYSHFELGAQYSTIRETNANLDAKNFSGFGGRFDWNLTGRLAFESQLDFFPEHAFPLPLVQGGQTLQAVFGVRAKAIQTHRISVFGLIRPGLLHFTDIKVLSSSTPGSFITQPATYFVLNLGGGIEYYPSPRWILRFDIEGDPYRVPANSAGGFVIPGKIDDTTRLSFGFAYRPGKLRENEPECKVPGNWEFGPLFSGVSIAREGLTENVRTEPAFGGYASYRFYGIFYLDGDVLYFPRGTSFSGPHDGGTILQTLVGLKGGIRRNRIGIFGKVRPGFNSYSDALSSVSSTSPETFSRSNTFVLDLGGIIELYPAPHSTLRVEAGDTHIYFGTANVSINGTVEPFPGGKLQHSIQFAVGYGWRF